MKIHKEKGRVVIEFEAYEVARSSRMEGWPIWAAFRTSEEGVYNLVRVGQTSKKPLSMNVSGAFCLILPYLTNSGREIYTIVNLETGEVSRVDTSDKESVKNARADSFARAFLHHILVEGGSAWFKSDVIIYDPGSQGGEVIEVKL